MKRTEMEREHQLFVGILFSFYSRLCAWQYIEWELMCWMRLHLCGKKMALRIIFDTVMEQSFFFLLLKHWVQQQAGNSVPVNQIEELALRVPFPCAWLSTVCAPAKYRGFSFTAFVCCLTCGPALKCVHMIQFLRVFVQRLWREVTFGAFC